MLVRVKKKKERKKKKHQQKPPQTNLWTNNRSFHAKWTSTPVHNRVTLL